MNIFSDKINLSQIRLVRRISNKFDSDSMNFINGLCTSSNIIFEI